jgi:hypothetical protein
MIELMKIKITLKQIKKEGVMAERPTDGQEQAQSIERPDQADEAYQSLNDPEFATFLQQYKEGQEFDWQNPEEITARKEVFDQYKEAGKIVKGFLSKELSSDLGEAGLRVSEHQLGDVDKYLQREIASRSPETASEFLNGIIREIQECQVLQKKVDDAEQEVARLSTKKEGQEQAYARLKKVTEPVSVYEKTRRFFDRAFQRERKAAISQAERAGLDSRDLDESQETIRNTLSDLRKSIENKENIHQQCESARNNLLDGLGVKSGAVAIAKKALQEYLTGKAKPDTRTDVFVLEKVQGQYEHYETDETLEGRYLEGLPANYREKLTGEIEKQIGAQIEKTAETISITGAKPYNGMRRALNGFFKREQIGSKKGTDKVREFVAGTLKTVYDRLQDSDLRKALIRGVCAENKIDITKANQPEAPAEKPAEENAGPVGDASAPPIAVESSTAQTPENTIEMNDAYYERQANEQANANYQSEAELARELNQQPTQEAPLEQPPLDSK